MRAVAHTALAWRCVLAMLVTWMTLEPRACFAQNSDAQLPSAATQTVFELGVHVGLPVALPVGQTSGIVLGVEGGGIYLRWLAFAGAGWASEASKSWAVEHTEWRLRTGLGARLPLGRGLFMVRLLGGATLIDESRTRHQSDRLDPAFGPFHSEATVVFGAVDLEAGVAVNVADGWGVAIFGGPTRHFGDDGPNQLGWSGRISLRRAWGSTP